MPTSYWRRGKHNVRLITQDRGFLREQVRGKIQKLPPPPPSRCDGIFNRSCLTHSAPTRPRPTAIYGHAQALTRQSDRCVFLKVEQLDISSPSAPMGNHLGSAADPLPCRTPRHIGRGCGTTDQITAIKA